MPRQNNIQIRKGTNSQWVSTNPTLVSGEPGFETDTLRLKIGDGSIAWSGLNYIGSKELLNIVRNDTGSTIYAGQSLYISGIYNNSIPSVDRYVANSISENLFIGLAASDISNSSTGYVVSFGQIDNLNTTGGLNTLSIFGETWTNGTLLYAHPTVAGKFTSVKPSKAVLVGTVIYAHGTQGKIFVRTKSYALLDDLYDVNTSSSSNGQFLQYNSSSGLWIPSSSGNFTTLNVNNNKVPTGSGTDGYVSKWNSAGNLVDSSIYENAGAFIQFGSSLYTYISDDWFGGEHGLMTSSQEAIAIKNSDGSFGYGGGYPGGENLVVTSVGNVGIGTIDPSAKLDVAGSLNINSDPTNNEGCRLIINNNEITLGTFNGSQSININGASEEGSTINIGSSYQDGVINLKSPDILINNGNLTIGGNLVVNGTTVTTNVDTVTVEDPVITLGQSSGNIVPNLTYDRGLALVRGTGLTAFMGWDTSASEFVLLSSGVAGTNSGTYSAGTYGNLRINNLNTNYITTSNSGMVIGGYSRFTINGADFGFSLDRGDLNAGFDGDALKLDVDQDNGVGYSTTLKTSAPSQNITIRIPSNSGTLSLLSDINTTTITGTLSVTKGGTGRTSYSNGQLLIGSGTSLASNTLTAGTGISITNGSGTITINTSGLQTVLTNPVTGTGVANHIAYWNSSSGIVADSGQLYWNSTNNRLGIGTGNPQYPLHVIGTGNIQYLHIGPIVSTGVIVSYTHPDDTELTNTDTIIPGQLVLTRANQNGIYNLATESAWDSNISPSGTEWNNDGWSNLPNLKNRTYSTLYSSVGGNLGNNLPNAELIMRHIATDRYWKIKFTSWTQGGGGGFSYTRQEVTILGDQGSANINADTIINGNTTIDGDATINGSLGVSSMSLNSLGIGTNSPGSPLTVANAGAAGTIAGASQTQIFQVTDASNTSYVNLGHFNCEGNASRGSFMLSNNGTGGWQDNVMQFMIHGASYPFAYYGSNTSDAGCAILTTQGSSITKLQIGNYNNVPIEFFTNNTFRMIINGSGNIGIGTKSPSTKLHVSGIISQSANHASAGLSTDQTITASTDTVLQLTDKDDPNNWWNASNYRFIPTVSGYYFVAAYANWDPGSGNGQINLQLRKNGTTFSICQNQMVTGVSLTQHVNGIVNLNGSSDYVELTAYTSSSPSQVINGTADRAWTKLEAYKIS